MANDTNTNRNADTPILIGVLAGIVFWFADSAVHAIFIRDGSFTGLLLSPAPASVWARLLALVMFVAFGLYMRGPSARLAHAEAALAERDRTIVHLSNHDQITGLPNRLLFNDRLQMALAHAQRHRVKVGLMLIDIDGFKRIKLSIGYQAGETLLKEFAARLSGCVRECDTVASLVGDEFGVILPEVLSADEALKVAVRIYSACKSPYRIDGHVEDVTFSTGIAVYPDDGEDAATLLKSADTALYRAKEPGMEPCQIYGGLKP